MKIVLAIGLSSGASGSGIDVALVETDGYEHIHPLVFQSHPYTEAVRNLLDDARFTAKRIPVPGPDPLIDQAASVVTSLQMEAVRNLLNGSGFERSEIDVIGMSGHPIAHRPELGMTWQVGNGELLSTETRITVVSDFAKTDCEAGGKGSPILPVFHRAIFADQPKPQAIVDLGHSARLTAFYSDGEICALDCGPGTALIDAWMKRHGSSEGDTDGTAAALGTVDEDMVETMIAHPWFRLPAPKSVDLDPFGIDRLTGMSRENGAATLTAFAADCVGRAVLQIDQRPDRMWVAGGGRKNATLIRMITARSGITTRPIDQLGWNGEAFDAQGMAYLAVRRLGLKSSTFPETTGVAEPHMCGVLYEPMDRRLLARD